MELFDPEPIANRKKSECAHKACTQVFMSALFIIAKVDTTQMYANK